MLFLEFLLLHVGFLLLLLLMHGLVSAGSSNYYIVIESFCPLLQVLEEPFS